MSPLYLILIIAAFGAMLYVLNYHGNVDPYAKRWMNIGLIALLFAVFLYAVFGMLGLHGNGPVRWRG